MEQPYIFDGIIYTSDNTSSLPPITVNINNKRTRTPSPILKVNKRNKLQLPNLIINNVSNPFKINTVKSKKNKLETFPVFSISKKIKTN
jgi:hypothetical protein